MDKPFEFICPQCQSSIGFLTDDRIVRTCPKCGSVVHPGPGESTIPARASVIRLQNRIDELTHEYNRAITPYLTQISTGRGRPPRYFEPEGPTSLAFLVFLFFVMVGLAGFLLWLRIFIFAVPLAIFAVWFIFKAPKIAKDKWETYQRLTHEYKTQKENLMREINDTIDRS